MYYLQQRARWKVKHLCKVWEAQESLENSHCVQDQLLSNNLPTNNAINSDVDDDLEKLIQTKSLTSSEGSSTFCQETQQYETGEVQKYIVLESFGSTPRLHHKTDILQWWISQKAYRPELYKLAVTVLAVPSTQVRFNFNLI